MKSWARRQVNVIRVMGKSKIFCIGANKTGTTSLKKEFSALGFIVGNQKRAERLFPFYQTGDFDPIMAYCRTAQVFQDAPFSLPETFKHVDRAYPGSKFILSVRDSPEQWYQSLIKFHAKMFGNGKIPTKNDLMNSGYIWKGWAWEGHKAVFKTPEDDLYNKQLLTQYYNMHNQSVLDYFKNRPKDLLVINLSEPDSYARFLTFIGVTSPRQHFPWENKTETFTLNDPGY